MIAVGMFLLFMSYGMCYWGYTLLRGYNLGFKQLFSPTSYYTGKWPPALAGNIVIIPDGTSASAISAATAGTAATAGNTTSSGASGTVSAGNAAAGAGVSTAAAKFSWGSGAEWACIQTLLAHESGGNPNAYNAGATCGGGSHAYGAFQSCSHGGCGGSSCGHDEYCGYGLSVAQTKLANCGNLYYQAIWGMNYIKATYGSPCNIPGITSGSYGGY